MSEETEKVETVVEDNEPIYYKPRSLNLVASTSGVLSWVVLVVFLANVGIQIWNIQAQLQGQQQVPPLATLLTEPSFISYLFTNLIQPLLLGLTLFTTLQAISIGLNALLEIDFNFSEPKE